MSTAASTVDHPRNARNARDARDARDLDGARGAGRYSVPVARALFAAIFVMAGLGHFSQPMIAMAAAQGVPLAGIAVPLSGVMALAGGLSVLLGYRARLGALVLL